jgi:hypothetical protein
MKLVGPSLARPEPPDARPRAEAARSAPAPRAPSPLPEAPMAARPSPAGAGFLQSFTPAGIGAAVGRLAKLAGVAAVGAMIAARSTLPHVDASVGCTPIYGAPLTQLEAPAQPNPSAGPSKVSVAFEGQ